MSIFDAWDARDAAAAKAAAVGSGEAEAAVLGAALLDPGHAREHLDDLLPSDLIDPRHRLVLTAIRALLAHDVVPDPVAVLGQLRRSGAVPALDDRGWGKFLVELVEGCPSASSAGTYRRAVLEDGLRRQTVASFERVAQAAQSASLDGLVELVHQEVAALGAAMRRAEVYPVSTR